MDVGFEGRGDFGGGDHRGEGEAVSDSFGHHHDVGNDALAFESPVVGAGAAEAGLDFVGNAESAVTAHDVVGLRKVAFGEDDGAADALDGLGDEACHLAGGGELDELLDVVGVVGGLVFVTCEGTAIGVGIESVMDAEALGSIVFPCAVGC